MEDRNQLTKRIIGCCFKVHKYLGPEFDQKVYHNALKLLFDKEGLQYESEKEFEAFFHPVLFQHQLISYLKASDIHIGLLINSGNKSCQVKRVMF